MTQATEEIGKRVRIARESQGLSQRELAERMGIDHTGVSKIENAEERDMRVSTINRLVKALDVDREWLMGG